MEDSKKLEHHDEISDKKINKETLEIKNKEPELTSSINKLNEDNNSKINLNENSINREDNDAVVDKKLDVNKKTDSTSNLNGNNNNLKVGINEIKKDQTSEDIKSTATKPNLDAATSKLAENVNNKHTDIANEKNLEDSKKSNLKAKSNVITDKNNPKETSTTIPVKAKAKPVKEPPIEKKPFLEFVNDYLIPEIKNEFKLKGKEVNKINLQKTHRPIAEDICWVIYCEIDDTCNFGCHLKKMI